MVYDYEEDYGTTVPGGQHVDSLSPFEPTTRCNLTLPVVAHQRLPINELPKFEGDGKDDLDSWISLVQRYLKQNPRPMHEQVYLVMFALTSTTRAALNNYANCESFTSVQHIFDTLRSIFTPTTNKLHRLAHAKQGTDELVTLYLSRLRKYVREIGSMGDDCFEEVTLYYFMGGLRSDILKRMPSDKPKTLEHALSKAKEIEGELGPRRDPKHESLFTMESYPKAAEQEPVASDQTRLLQSIISRLDNLPSATLAANVAQAERPHTRQPENRSFPSSSSRFGNIECFHCHKLGHTFRRCRMATEEQRRDIEQKLREGKLGRGSRSISSAADALNSTGATRNPSQSLH
jgi:hypothetical protein